MSDIRAGDVVECVDASPCEGLAPDQAASLCWLQEGSVYRVAEMVWTPEGFGLHLEGQPFFRGPDGQAEPWHPRRFRKIDPTTYGRVDQGEILRRVA